MCRKQPAVISKDGNGEIITEVKVKRWKEYVEGFFSVTRSAS